ncbi:curli-like amyloid fiber formation chaperone CsgH [Rhizobium lusitanum]|uniref:curli-like amyloid fiber formation chaperone CsgH n=1 Tax=Rhizobium lusitanum TaxID=293958 RepID=UPI00248649C0|nr:curli-like amyloid fiber formation chaperone CsgH [Rhizobium lusitanum]
MVNALPPADTCKIEYQDIGGMTHLAAVLIPAKAREGTYQFQVRSISEGGVSSNMQGGEFSARGGHREDLSKTIVGNAPSSWAAELQVFDASGNLICRFAVPEKK